VARSPSLNQAREPSRSVHDGRTESAMTFPAHACSPFGANGSEFARYIQNSDSDAMLAPALVTPTVPRALMT
jgi:hypothetical protein